jgi:kynurenine formamidase
VGRDTEGRWTEDWRVTYTVDANGKLVDAKGREPNNWGRWGEDDERGTVNFVTPEIVRDAARLVEQGRVISLAIPLDAKGPIHPTRSGIVHMYGYSGSDFVAGTKMAADYPNFQGTDDYIFMPLQGSTQWDGLAHFFYKDTMYNGFWIGHVESYAGARRCSIHQMKDRLVGRGVLLDLPRHRGVERIEPGTAIKGPDLDDCAEAQGVEIRTGDILLIRTGHVPWYYTLDDPMQFWKAGAPGLSIETPRWLYEKEVAAVAMDNIAIEVEPFEEGWEHVYPLHAWLIRDLGLTLGEVWWLEELAEACAQDGRWEFFLAAPPLNVTNASGAPLNPIAIK